MNMNRIIQLVMIVGVICFGWFIVCFAIFKWDTNQVNMSMGIMGSILLVGGLNASSKRR